MLPSDMNLNIKTGTAGYNNKILVSDGKISLASLNQKIRQTTKIATIHKVVTQKPTIAHEEERAALIIFLTGGLTIWFMFR